MGTVHKLDLPGASGDSATTPSAASNQITGDLAGWVHLLPAGGAWAVSSVQNLIAKRFGSEGEYAFRFESDGQISLFRWQAVSSFTQWKSTVAPSTALTDGVPAYIGWEHDTDNGASGNAVTFYTSADGSTWTELDTVSKSGTFTSVSTSAAVGIGARPDGSEPFEGQIFAAQVIDSADISGTPVLSPDPDDAAVTDTSWAASGTGETWTLNGDAGLALVTPVADGTFRGDLPGANADRFTTPDSAAVSITGDLDLRVHAALEDWTPASLNRLVNKWQAGGDSSYSFGVLGGGVLRLDWTPDNATFISRDSTVAPSVADGAALHVRATLDVDNGSTQHVVTFYTSADGTTWTQLGDPVTNSGTTSIHDGADPVAVGSRSDGGNHPTNGSIYSAEIRDGIDGTLVASFDADDASYIDDDSWVSSATGERWTANGNAQIRPAGDITVTVNSDGGGDYSSISNAMLDADVTDGWYKVEITNSATYTENVDIDGITGTPTADNYVWLTVAAGNRHSGVPAPTGHARMTGFVQMNEPYTRIEYLEITRAGTCLEIDVGHIGRTISNCIIAVTSTNSSNVASAAATSGTGDLSIDNTVLLNAGSTNAPIVVQGDAAADVDLTVNLDHCTLYGDGTPDRGVWARARANTGLTHSVTINLHNSVFAGFGNNVVNALHGAGGGTDQVTVNGSHNTHDTAAKVAGPGTDNTTDWVDASTGGITTVTTTADAIIVTDLTAGVENLELVEPTGAGSNLALEAGTVRTAPDSRQDLTRDIRGAARIAPFDIGAFEISAPSPADAHARTSANWVLHAHVLGVI